MGCNKSQGRKWYSEWDSNPHFKDFKSFASAVGLSEPCNKSQGGNKRDQPTPTWIHFHTNIQLKLRRRLLLP